MKKMMKLNIAICDDNKLVLENEKALIEETLKEMGMPYKMDKYQNPETTKWPRDLKLLLNEFSVNTGNSEFQYYFKASIENLMEL